MAPGGESFQARNLGAADICRRLRAMARLRKSEITHSNGRVNADLACNWNKRVTRVLSPTLWNSHVSSKCVARGERGAEKSCMRVFKRRSGCHSKIPWTGLDPSG